MQNEGGDEEEEEEQTTATKKKKGKRKKELRVQKRASSLQRRWRLKSESNKKVLSFIPKIARAYDSLG